MWCFRIDSSVLCVFLTFFFVCAICCAYCAMFRVWMYFFEAYYPLCTVRIGTRWCPDFFYDFFFFVYGSSGIFRISVLFCGIFIFRGILRMLTSPVWFEVCPDSCMLCCSHHAVRACCCCAGLCVRFARICSMVLGSRPRLVSTCYCAGLCVRFARFCSMVLGFRPRLVSTIFRGCSLF